MITDPERSGATGARALDRLAAAAARLLDTPTAEVVAHGEGGDVRLGAWPREKPPPDGLSATLEAPIPDEGEGPLGTLRVRDEAGRQWTNRDREVVAALAEAASSEVGLRRARIAEQQERDARTRLAAENEATRVLAESETVEEAMSRILPALSGALGWQAASFWRVTPDGEALRAVAVWHEPGQPADTFTERTRATSFRRGEGLPGRVWATGEPAWITDVTRDRDFPRGEAAAEAGLHGAFGIPVTIGGEVYGVIEVFTREVREVDSDLLQLMGALGSQVGQFIRRRGAEQGLRESEARFRAFTESIPDAAFTMDTGSRIVHVNAAAERIFGWPREELLGKHMTVLIPERHREAHERGVARYLRTGRKAIPWTGVQLPGMRRDGSEVPLEITFGEYELDGQHFFTGIARDVSERVSQQQRLEETASELEAAVDELTVRTREAEQAQAAAEEANQAKADFLAVMSHELRTPLNAVLGYVDLLLSGIPEPVPDAAVRQLERVRFAARHLFTLIEEILSFSRIEAGRESVQLQSADLAAVAREAAELAEPLARDKGLELVVRGAEEPLPVETDAPKVRQILFNLLSNAVKFTPQGRVELAVRREEPGLVMEVRDTGIGIDATDLERIFETFWQVERPETRTQGGTGLGLTVSRHLARLMGGDVTVESTRGEGSTFTVRLPEGGEE